MIRSLCQRCGFSEEKETGTIKSPLCDNVQCSMRGAVCGSSVIHNSTENKWTIDHNWEVMFSPSLLRCTVQLSSCEVDSSSMQGGSVRGYSSFVFYHTEKWQGATTTESTTGQGFFKWEGVFMHPRLIRYSDWEAGNVMSAAPLSPSLKHWSVHVSCFTAVNICLSSLPWSSLCWETDSPSCKVEAFLIPWRDFRLSLVCSGRNLLQNSLTQSFSTAGSQGFSQITVTGTVAVMQVEKLSIWFCFEMMNAVIRSDHFPWEGKKKQK